MKYGIATFRTDSTTPPGAHGRLADAGYDRAVPGPMPGGDDVTIPMPDELAKRVEAGH